MISVTIINNNGVRLLKEVLVALSSFDEVLIYDSGSTDDSLIIAKSFPNVTIHQHPFNGFGAAHNHAASLAKHDWIFSIDADEIVSEELIKEISQLKLDPKYIYDITFHNYFNGKWIKWCGWYPESHIRLYNRKSTGFTNVQVHEGIKTDHLKIVALKSPIYHYSYASISDFLVKMERYSTLFAKQYVGKKRASFFTALYHGAGAFLKCYFLKRGFLGGFEGYIISRYNGETAFYKYLKLKELNNVTLANVSSRWKREACKFKKHARRPL